MIERSAQVKQDEMNCLRGQLLGLEAILLELTPFRVPLKRQEIQDFYDNYFDWVSKPKGSISRHELRRHFNHKANQVQHLVDSAESLGNAADKLNLIYAACSLPGERTAPLNEAVERFCRRLINEAKIDERLLAAVSEQTKISEREARLLLASTMFLITEYVEGEGGTVPLYRLLDQLIELFACHNHLHQQDPFMLEARCLAEAMRNQ